MHGVTLMAGGLFIAAWSTYGFETAVCYTREFKDPAKDTFKAILYSGLLCILVFTIVPLSFQGVLGRGPDFDHARGDRRPWRGDHTRPSIAASSMAIFRRAWEWPRPWPACCTRPRAASSRT